MPNDKKSQETEALLGSVQDVERAIEAILFAAGYPVKYEKLAEVIGIPQRDIRHLMARMAEGYGNRGIQLLYPNPASSIVNIELGSVEYGKDITVDIYDMLGRNVATSNHNSSEGSIELNVSDFSEGLYFVRMNIDGHSVTEKVLIAR